MSKYRRGNHITLHWFAARVPQLPNAVKAHVAPNQTGHIRESHRTASEGPLLRLVQAPEVVQCGSPSAAQCADLQITASSQQHVFDTARRILLIGFKIAGSQLVAYGPATT